MEIKSREFWGNGMGNFIVKSPTPALLNKVKVVQELQQ